MVWALNSWILHNILPIVINIVYLTYHRYICSFTTLLVGGQTLLDRYALLHPKQLL